MTQPRRSELVREIVNTVFAPESNALSERYIYFVMGINATLDRLAQLGYLNEESGK